MKFTKILRYLIGITIYNKVPVYNINWFKNADFYNKILKDIPITLVDVGARNNSLEELIPLQNNINYIGFDADIDEVARLNSKKSNYKSTKYFSSYVGSSNSSVKFGLHHNGGESSVYPFDKYFNNWFRDGDENYVKEFIELKSNCLDDLINEDVDVMKLDTQGTEYEILTGAKKCLDNVLIVESEVEFIQIYEGQKLAHDVFALMYSKGFELLYLNRVYGKSSRFKGEARGQLIFGDALFGISRNKVMKLDFKKQIKYLALLINYGHLDFAFDLYSNNISIQENFPEIGKFLKNLNNRNKFKLAFKIFIDKLIFVLLTLRKTNGMSYDSDRSWPIR